MQNRLISLLVVTLLASQALGFWQYGHLFVARIAYDILSKEAPQALKQANDMLAVLKKADPDCTKLEGDYPFVESATYADEIKAKGGTWQSGWHFIDTPYLDEGGSVDDYPNFKFDQNHIGKAIPQIIQWLTNSGDYKTGFVYETVMNYAPNEDEAKSEALRLLIHYLGDIHQPLHATSRVDSKYPKGDAGGNFFKVPIKKDAKNLHSVWDSVVYLWADTPQLPFSSGDWSTFGDSTTQMVNSFTIDPSEYSSNDVDKWAQESFELSKSNVYTGINENQAVPQDYIDKNQVAIQKQIVLGGLRLANVIKTIFGSSKAQEFLN